MLIEGESLLNDGVVKFYYFLKRELKGKLSLVD